MSVLIKGINMPDGGYVDIRLHANGKYATTQTSNKPFYMKMDVVEMPPHGQLIDVDVLGEIIYKLWVDKKITNTKYNTFNEILDYVPTVIEADNEKELSND